MNKPALCVLGILIFLLVPKTPGESIFRYRPLPAMKADNEITVTVDAGKAVKLKKTAFGFNANLMRQYYTHAHPAFIEKYTYSGAQFIRFPGGTVANMYNWRTGYMQDFPGIHEKYRRKVKGWNRILKVNGGCQADDFITFVRQTGTAFSVVLNVFSMTPADAKDWMEDFREKGIAVTHVEVGNEIYLDFYRARFPDVEAYIREARQHIAAVKSVFPNAKCGLVGSHIGYHRIEEESEDEGAAGGNSREVNGFAWNRRIGAVQEADAVIVHMYTYAGLAQKPSSEEIYRRTISASDAMFDHAQEYYKKVFPEKELWISEWNVAGFTAEKGAIRHHDKHLNLVFSADFQLKMLCSDRMDCGAYHNLPNFLSLRDHPKGHVRYPAAKGLDHSPHIELFRLLSTAVQNAEEIVPVDIEGCGTFEGDQLYKGRYFPDVTGAYAYGDSAKYLLLVNRWNRTYGLEQLTAGKKYEGAVLARSIYSESLEAEKIGDGGIRLAGQKAEHPEQIMIPPFSVNVLQLTE